MITTRQFETLGLDDKQHSRRHRQTYNSRNTASNHSSSRQSNSRNHKIGVRARNHSIDSIRHGHTHEFE